MAISVNQAKRYCKEKLSNIENYDKAVHYDTQLWICHHRDEVKVLPSGMVVFRSLEEMKEKQHKKSKFYNEFGMTFEEYKKIHNMKESVSTIRRMYKNGGL